MVNSYQWVNDWVFVARDEFTYDEKDRDTLYIRYVWNQNTQWDGSSRKTEYTFDDRGNMILLADYLWDVNTSTWVVDSRQESTYGENGQFISRDYYVWDTLESKWIGITKNESTSDEFGYPVLEITYSWDSISDNWTNAIQKTNYYSEYIPTVVPGISDKKILVYPNPAKDFIQFDQGNTSETAIVELFDIQGKKVLEQEYLEGMKIPVRNLAKGLYIYKLNEKGTIYKGKILIE